MKIAVYAIARDERKFAARFAASAREADLISVADTGSTDGTCEALAAEGVAVHRISIDPWRFDDARNAALALVPADVDVCVSLDLDEVMAPGWRALLEAAWTEGTTRAAYTFVFSRLGDGSPAGQFLNNRIHCRHGYRWRHACHEGLYPDRLEERCVAIPELRVDHYPDDDKSRGTYLPLLEAGACEEPDDPRMAHYLGREYYFHGRCEEAAAVLERYLTLKRSGPPAERAATMLYLARCRETLGAPETALVWRRRAVAEDATMREAWVDLAEALYRAADWPGCYGAALSALAIEHPTGAFMTEPRAWGALAHDLASIASWHLGLVREALRHAARALEIAPADERIRANLKLFETGVSQQEGAVPPLSSPAGGPDCKA